MRKQLITLILIICSMSCAAQQNVAQHILWSASRPLTWNDFSDHKPPRSKFAAVTFSKIRYKRITDSAGNLSTTVSCYFNAKKSWKRDNKLKQDLLLHEQGHFNIAELNARKLRKSFSNYELRRKNNCIIACRLRLAFWGRVCKCHRLQHKYDRGTNHSKDTNTQEQWNKKIKSELAELGSYEVK